MQHLFNTLVYNTSFNYVYIYFEHYLQTNMFLMNRIASSDLARRLSGGGTSACFHGDADALTASSQKLSSTYRRNSPGCVLHETADLTFDGFHRMFRSVALYVDLPARMFPCSIGQIVVC